MIVLVIHLLRNYLNSSQNEMDTVYILNKKNEVQQIKEILIVQIIVFIKIKKLLDKSLRKRF